MEKTKNKLKVLMVAAEASPLVKVGGLSDVVGSLPEALNGLSCDARIMIPKYGSIDEKKYGLERIINLARIDIDGRQEKISIWRTRKAIKRTTVYLIGNKRFDRSDVYQGNNPQRFLFFSAACLEALPLLGFKPDVIHCHDFHTALVPAILKTDKYPFLKDIKTLYTIHNLEYQGKTTPRTLRVVDLSHDSLASLARDARDGDINFMVQGIINSNLVNTVSPSYAKEIITPGQAAGLEKVIAANSHKLSGIINGLNIEFFDPSRDKYIVAKYGASSLGRKIKNKVELQKVLGLPVNKEKAVVGFVSRLAEQKGVELITEKLVKESDCQFVFLGSGQKEYESYLKKLERKYPDKVKANIMFDISLAQKIYAGSDVFLMPSRFEPCGLGQMIAMRYATVVVARETGGLKDTVNKNVGFTFKEFKAESLAESFKKALEVYYNYPEKWLKLQKNCLKIDFSWNNSAKKYLSLYRRLKTLKED